MGGSATCFCVSAPSQLWKWLARWSRANLTEGMILHVGAKGE
jgi:hypothetical protein